MYKKIFGFILAMFVVIPIQIVSAASLVVKSDKQEYDHENKLIKLNKDVQVTIDDVQVRSPKAFLTLNKEGKPDTATFVEGAHVIRVTKDAKSEVKAEILKLSLISKEAEAEGKVDSYFAQVGKPVVTIKSDYQSFNINTNLMEAKSNVIMTYGDIKATGNQAKIWLNKKNSLDRLKIIGNAKVIQEKIVASGEIISLDANTEIMTSEGSSNTIVRIDDSDVVNISAKHQEFNNKTNIAMASGAVKVIYKEYVAVGPKAVLFPDKKTKKPNKVIFSGRSTIAEQDKSIAADDITITMNPKYFTAEGNVVTTINDLKNIDSGNKK